MAMEKEVKGIGGWLAFYLVFIALGFFGILSNTLYFLLQKAFALDVFTIAYLFLNFTLLGLMFTSFTTILAEKKKAIKRNRHLLWFWLISNVFIYLVFFAIALSGAANGAVISLSGLFFLAITTAWIFYWNKSDRVKNTFIK